MKKINEQDKEKDKILIDEINFYKSNKYKIYKNYKVYLTKY